jgi:hypothetical protein
MGYYSLGGLPIEEDSIGGLSTRSFVPEGKMANSLEMIL